MTETTDAAILARQAWLAVLARASGAELHALLDAAPRLSPHTRLRGPEIGLVMVQGRAGGTGDPFCLGEMTATRCTVRDEHGGVGHAYVAGRDLAKAELAARLDAALQDPARRQALLDAVIAPLAEAQQTARACVARQAAATRVEFATLATMRT